MRLDLPYDSKWVGSKTCNVCKTMFSHPFHQKECWNGPAGIARSQARRMANKNKRHSRGRWAASNEHDWDSVLGNDYGGEGLGGFY